MTALRTLVRFCLRYRHALVLVVAGLCALAFFAVRNSSVRAFPSFEPPVVKVITRVAGLSPRGIELSVTDVLEQGLSGLAAVRSRSEPGVSIISLIFRSHTRLALDRKAVAARLSEVSATLPSGAVAHIERLTSMVGVAAQVAVLGKGVTPLTVGRLVETRIAPEL
ncbi:chemiosmotic efflux system protein A, partial [mine drainage metagenome]